MLHHQATQYIRVPRRRRQKGAENVFEEIRAENFPNLGKKRDIQIQETEFQIRGTQRDPQHNTL